MVVEDEPDLTAGENVILFLTRQTFITDDAPADVYSIFWGKDGKFVVADNQAKGGYRNEVYNLEELIAKIK